jgi:Gluconate 2-dehydrogenase subunit 3
MHRRDLLQILGACSVLPFVPREAGAAIAFGRRLHKAVHTDGLEALTPDQARLVTSIADQIIPRTDTPGASDVGVTEFIDHLLAHWYANEARDHFMTGLADLDRRAGGSFVELSSERQVALLTLLDGVKGTPGTAEAAFAMLKSLTVYGYFTAERVVKEVTKEPIIPGRFDGCVRF